ncbi:ABC transporter permease [Ahrensia sp. R2A130]|uniref:ABC transporter permease n=1 Tax=Ahrensia sp. R2A130 TaxID=744979 RepID=UPI0001E0A456|nr:ABC transporter permease [Ahrensia sp. R2A130]EFL90670.1 dipeptide ABC transporter, permease protein DppB [Ahrensia sp. R2A130]
MTYLLIRKAAWAIATLAVASLFVFLTMEVVPGDAAQVMLGINATDEAVAALRERLGLDLPLWQRYLSWVGGMVQGDFGTSYIYSEPVSYLVADRITVSLPLAIIALVLSTAIAIPIGVWTASRRGSMLDTVVMGITQVGIAIPNFWFALLMVYVFAIGLQWLPAGGFPGWDAGVFPALKALAMPAIALALPQAAILARVTRSALLETMGQDYIRTARAKGLSRRATLWGHALRNALIPVLTIMGLQFAYLLAGTIIIENVFYLPGLGRLVFQAITQRDIIVVESVVMMLVATNIIINFIVDLLYAVVDPRLRKAPA